MSVVCRVVLPAQVGVVRPLEQRQRKVTLRLGKRCSTMGGHAPYGFSGWRTTSEFHQTVGVAEKGTTRGVAIVSYSTCASLLGRCWICNYNQLYGSPTYYSSIANQWNTLTYLWTGLRP